MAPLLLASPQGGVSVMQFQLPTSPGMRKIAGEVGIIVIGVLIALGAQEVVDNARWAREVTDFRKSVNAEVANNLATYEIRIKQNGCVKARLDQLEAWLQSGREGRPRALSAPIGHPVSLSLNTSVWGSRDSSLMSHMPMESRLAYGDVYDSFTNNEAHRLDERAAWLALSEFDGATELRHEDLMRLRGLITRARFRDLRMGANVDVLLKKARIMGISPKWDPTWPSIDPSLCDPILGPESKT